METFPIDTLRPARFQIYLSRNLRGSGASLADGGSVADLSGGGHWLGAMKNITISTPAQIRKWRALMLEFNNGVGEMILPIIDFTNQHLVGGTFTTTGGLRRATQLTIANPEGKVFEGGEYFTIVHPNAGERAYCIKMNPSVRSGGAQVVKFRPPLREQVGTGTSIDIDNPRFVARLTSAPNESWPEMEPPFKARPSIQYAESSKWQELL